MGTAEAIKATLQSVNVPDSNMEPANVVDVIHSLAYSTRKIAEAITPIAVPGNDVYGGNVGCLTEAVMGMTRGLSDIAESINNLAEAVRERK